MSHDGDVTVSGRCGALRRHLCRRLVNGGGELIVDRAALAVAAAGEPVRTDEPPLGAAVTDEPITG